MKLFRIFALCMIMVLSLAGLAFAAVTHVSPMEVYDYMRLDPTDDNYIGYLIDIRTPEEWCGGDYFDPRPGKGWKNTDGHPVMNGEFLEGRVLNISSHLFSDAGREPNLAFNGEFENPDRYAFVTDEPFVLICASGKRSYGAADALDTFASNSGLNWDVYNMVGGFKGRDCDGDYCLGDFCIDGHCPGWKESWDGFAEGLPRFDPGGYSAYNPVPIPGAIFLLGPGLIGIIGIRRKFMR